MIDAKTFKSVMRHLPGAVTIITSRLGAERVGMAATAVCSLSAEPPLLLACVNTTARSCDKIRRSGHFTVNLLSSSDVTIARHFSSADMHLRFEAGSWVDTAHGGLALTTARAAFECALAGDIPAGTHSIFLGRIEAATAHPEFPALLYVDGRYTTLAEANL